MTVTSVMLTQEGSGLSGSGFSADKIQRSYDSRYRAITDGAANSSKEVEAYFRNGQDENGDPLPYYGRTWKWRDGGTDVEAICNRFKVNHQPGSMGVFTVEVGFEPQQQETKTKQDQDGNQSDDPADWLDSISVSYTQMSVPCWKAIFEGFNPANINNADFQVGAELTPSNSARTPYDPPLEKLLQIKVLRISKYVRDINDSDDWQDYINDQDFTIDKLNVYNFKQVVKKWQGWLKSVGGNFEFINGDSWYRRDVELWINPLPFGWVDEYLDKGLQQKIIPGGKKPGKKNGETFSATDFGFGEPRSQNIVGKNGIPVTEPVLLDGLGQPLEEGEPNVWLLWRFHRQKNLLLFNW